MGNIRLLPKREIDAAKASDKKREIDEGLKLARRVDSLRETTAIEEANLINFRDKTSEEVKKQINELIGERDALAGEIIVLDSERQLLQEPLDVEWTRLKSTREGVDHLGGVLRKREFQIIQRESAITKREGELETEENLVKNLSESASRNLRNSEILMENTKLDVSNLRSQAEAMITDAQLREQEARSKESEVATRELELHLREEVLMKREKAVSDGERALRDKYATLARTEQRLHGGRR